MRHLLVCLTLVATSALAKDFEGVITGKPTSADPKSGGLQSITMSLSAAGARVEAVLVLGQQNGEGDMHTVMLYRAAEPDTAYILNGASKSYMKHDLSKARAAAKAVEAPKVEKLGKGTFLGRSVERVRVTSSNGTWEYWVDTSIRFPASALGAFGMDRSGKNTAWVALERAGVLGIPLKEMSAAGNGWEATSIEQKSLPASLFEVPADYHETKNGLDMLPPAQRAAMEQRLKSLTPEQRAKYEEAMKNMAK